LNLTFSSSPTLFFPANVVLPAHRTLPQHAHGCVLMS
jgi:hypothetical protein